MKNATLLIVKAGGTYCYHWALNGYPTFLNILPLFINFPALLLLFLLVSLSSYFLSTVASFCPRLFSYSSFFLPLLF
jgi:hypothetical protein